MNNMDRKNEKLAWILYTGIGLVIIGVLALLIGFGMSGSAEYSDTLNIGLLNDKSNLIMTGGFMSVCGVVFIATDMIIFALLQPSISAEDAMKYEINEE